jgi:hypothetical protein
LYPTAEPFVETVLDKQNGIRINGWQLPGA